MARPKQEINPKRGVNLKILCDEQKITQSQLAALIPLSQQTISKIINGAASLTEQTATRIVELYPQYRFEWLMGYDEFKTETEKSLFEFSEFNNEWKQRLRAVRILAFLAGYEIDIFDESTRSTGNINTYLRAISSGYKISKDGNILATCPLVRFNLLALDIQELVEQRIKSYIREVTDDGKR